MRFASFVVIGITGLALAGCQTPTNQQMGIVGGSAVGALVGNQFGSGSGKVAATIAGGLVGGLIGNAIGVSMDAQSQQRAQAAEFQALEYGRPGAPVDWSSQGNRGEVTPGPRYRVNSYECRDYTHEIWIDGRPQTARGTACRQPDGTWRPVN
ncbi:glycine zipper 2TM domain-containing protein [Kaistia dalseonensis]|uniref:17 kDa surface antigen n=1 Tax=Kaistia dalseonensis TaxID=410840 RepID=A0ABU0H013_9HYPH|nr:glycine zipper 2TM domain-containing protein [Kaistia dalseonensis]MCX5493096.1 glycine zipper 2TM domain-containing protein [Kaistia dalseonensis]MDQ0435651.1 surface antigen [Kaistia dalseonensis]